MQRAHADPFADLTLEQRRTARALYDETGLSPQELAPLADTSVDAAQLRLDKLKRLGVAERTRRGVYILTQEYLDIPSAENYPDVA